MGAVSDYASINQEARDIGSRYAGEDGVHSNELIEAEDPKALVQARCVPVPARPHTYSLPSLRHARLTLTN
jgi:hypothetical protein